MTQQQKSLALGGGAVVMLAIAAYVFFARSNPRPQFAHEHVERTVDINTGEEFTIRAPNGETAPYVNPKTGQRTLYSWYFCTDCEKRLIPELSKDREGIYRQPMMPRCPLCKGANVSPWIPDFPEQAHPKGDAPLPKLAAANPN